MEKKWEDILESAREKRKQYYEELIKNGEYEFIDKPAIKRESPYLADHFLDCVMGEIRDSDSDFAKFFKTITDRYEESIKKKVIAIEEKKQIVANEIDIHEQEFNRIVGELTAKGIKMKKHTAILKRFQNKEYMPDCPEYYKEFFYYPHKNSEEFIEHIEELHNRLSEEIGDIKKRKHCFLVTKNRKRLGLLHNFKDRYEKKKDIREYGELIDSLKEKKNETKNNVKRLSKLLKMDSEIYHLVVKMLIINYYLYEEKKEYKRLIKKRSTIVEQRNSMYNLNKNMPSILDTLCEEGIITERDLEKIFLQLDKIELNFKKGICKERPLRSYIFDEWWHKTYWFVNFIYERRDEFIKNNDILPEEVKKLIKSNKKQY